MICIDLRAPIFKWLLKREFYTCEEATGPCFAQSSKHEADVSACHWHWAPAKSQVMHIALWQRLSRVVTDKSDVSQISGDFDLSESSPMILVAERPACTGSVDCTWQVLLRGSGFQAPQPPVPSDPPGR